LTVLAVTAAVDDVHLARLGVPEDEEVVADQLELKNGLFGVHLAHPEVLRLDDRRLDILVHAWHPLRSGPVGAGGSASPGASLVAVARDLALELVDELVDRRPHVGRGLAGAQHRAFRPDRGLGHVVGGDRGVALDRELQLDARILELPLELRELPLRIAADRVADLEVPALHVKLHTRSLGRCPGT
jgi:hypothetical protein